MEEFQPSPLPTLRLPGSSSALPQAEFLDFSRKPLNSRRQADSPLSSPNPTSSWTPPSSLPFRPRTTSPLSGSHARSRSAASLAPPMTRTQSLPGVNGAGHILYAPQLRLQTTSSSPNRSRTPKKPVDESFPSSPTRVSVFDPERKSLERSSSPTLGLGLPSASPARQLRRPSSPLRHIGHSTTGASSGGVPTPPPSAASSPPYKPYDYLSSSYMPPASYTSSSVPSTPTSTRSRSPSISSLETIPDSPDAEEAALEAERIAQLKAAADAADGGDGKSKSGIDIPTRGRTLSFGSRDKRKRWSVCGAERRGDLDLETIWEDGGVPPPSQQ